MTKRLCNKGWAKKWWREAQYLYWSKWCNERYHQMVTRSIRSRQQRPSLKSNKKRLFLHYKLLLPIQVSIFMFPPASLTNISKFSLIAHFVSYNVQFQFGNSRNMSPLSTDNWVTFHAIIRLVLSNSKIFRSFSYLPCNILQHDLQNKLKIINIQW